MYTGGCLCGCVRFEIRSRIRNIVYCHCSMCRKAQGSAFATNGNVRASDFVLLSGQEKLSRYESSPGQVRYFCAICGSPVYSSNATRPEQIRVRLGTIESNIDERPIAHIFAASKANWDTITDALPQFAGYEPNR